MKMKREEARKEERRGEKQCKERCREDEEGKGDKVIFEDERGGTNKKGEE